MLFGASCALCTAQIVLMSLLLITSESNALALSTATVTTTHVNRNSGLQHGFQPIVTRTSSVAELRRRQTQITLATCGFIEGDANKPVTCGSSLYCATTSTFVGCCELTSCRDIFTSCYDLLGSTCDQACQANAQNLVCSSSLPYCARYNYEGGSVGLGCAQIRGYTSTVLLSTGTVFGSLTTPTPTSTTTTASNSPTPTPNPPSASSGLSTGATAGIAIGAALIGALLLVLVWFRLRRRNKKAESENAPNTPSPPTDTKEVTTKDNNRFSQISELPHSPKTPMSPDFMHTSQPSPGMGPPHYSRLYEMPGSSIDERPKSYTATELSSTRG